MDLSKETYQAIVEKEKMYRQIVEYSVESIIIHTNHKVLYVNQSGADFLRATKEDIIGASVLDIIQDDYKEVITKRIQKVMTENKPAELIEQTMVRLDGTLVDVEVNCNPVIYGDQRAIQSVLRDITKRKEAEKKLKEVLREINEISAPIVPLLEGIAVLPLVGSIDEDRAKQLLDAVPSKIQKQQIDCLIIDFSGVYNLDTVVTEYLFKITDVIHLLGIRPIITGMRPDLAQTAIRFGVDLFSIQTHATVKRALHYLNDKK